MGYDLNKGKRGKLKKNKNIKEITLEVDFSQKIKN
jgi:hypothetical protein